MKKQSNLLKNKLKSINWPYVIMVFCTFISSMALVFALMTIIMRG